MRADGQGSAVDGDLRGRGNPMNPLLRQDQSFV